MFITNSLLLPLLLLVVSSASAADNPRWGYGEDNGPKHWPTLYKRWCSGRKQSPIKLSTAKSVHDASLSDYVISDATLSGRKYKLANDGHKVLVDFDNALTNVSLTEHKRECYRPHSVHWHWGAEDTVGSEHWLEGRQLPMEGHIVMWDCRFYDSFKDAQRGIDGLAVLGVFYEVDTGASSDNSSGIGRIASRLHLPKVKHCDQCKDEGYKNSGIDIDAFSITELLPNDTSKYFVYYGSLTTPDCRENVLWTVFRQPVKIPAEVMEKFRNVEMPKDGDSKRQKMVNNFRTPQELNPTDPVGARRQLSRSFNACSCLPPTPLLLLPVSLLLLLLMWLL